MVVCVCVRERVRVRERDIVCVYVCARAHGKVYVQTASR